MGPVVVEEEFNSAKHFLFLVALPIGLNLSAMFTNQPKIKGKLEWKANLSLIFGILWLEILWPPFEVVLSCRLVKTVRKFCTIGPILHW